MVDDGKADKAKGTAKDGVGEALGDEQLRREGKADKTAGSAKEKLGKAVDRIRGARRSRSR